MDIVDFLDPPDDVVCSSLDDCLNKRFDSLS